MGIPLSASSPTADWNFSRQIRLIQNGPRPGEELRLLVGADGSVSEAPATPGTRLS